MSPDPALVRAVAEALHAADFCPVRPCNALAAAEVIVRTVGAALAKECEAERGKLDPDDFEHWGAIDATETIAARIRALTGAEE